MKKFILFFNKSSTILALILVASAALRLVPLEKLMVFTPDESYILYYVQTLVRNFHTIWIGVSALGFDFYMGPGWIYFLYPFVAISKNDPLIIGIISSIIGVVTTYVVYWFGKKLYDTKVGLLASLFYGLSSLIVFYDQQPYPNAVPLTSLLIAISLYLSRKNKKWLYLFAASYGAVFHLHLSLVLLVFAGIYWVLRYKLLDLKTIIISGAIFIATVSPMIVFDYYHNASNITAPLRVLKSIGEEGKTKVGIEKKLTSITSSLSRLWYLDSGKSNTDEILYPCNTSLEAKTTKGKLPLVLISLFILYQFFITAFKNTTGYNPADELNADMSFSFGRIPRHNGGENVMGKGIWKDEKRSLFLVMSLCFIVPYLTISSINSVEYYLLGFFPLFFIMTASVISKFRKSLKYCVYFLIFLFLLRSVYVVFTASGEYGLKTKKIMVEKVMQTIENSSYELSEEGGVCQGAAGWRYLYMSYGRIPVRSSEDKSFYWLWEENEISKERAKFSVVMEDRRVSKQKHQGYKHLIQEGAFNAYIYEN